MSFESLKLLIPKTLLENSKTNLTRPLLKFLRLIFFVSLLARFYLLETRPFQNFSFASYLKKLNLIYHSTLSDDNFLDLILRGKQKEIEEKLLKKTNTKFLSNFLSVRNKKEHIKAELESPQIKKKRG